MTPAYKPGEHVLSINWWISMKPQDVVVAMVKGKLVIKRIALMKWDQVFLVGDNKKQSTDSRTFGWVAKSDIIGIILCKY